MNHELAHYNSEGFFIAKGLLSQSKIAFVLDSFLATLNDQLSVVSDAHPKTNLLSALQALFSADVDRYKKTVAALWRKEHSYRLLHDDAITGFLHEKFGWKDLFVPGGQVIHIMAHELQIPNGYFGLVPHQDFPSVQGSLDGVVVWIPIVDVDRANFPLEIIPRSHLRGILPMIEHGESTWEVHESHYEPSDFIPVEVNVGDVVFMSVFTIHRSSTTGTPNRLRLAMSTRFDNAQEQTFVERSYPTAYRRSVHRELYYPNFPSPEQIAAVFSVCD